MKYRLGLTGSIGMGKSTTARLFAEAGCAVWDADAAVHRLYGVGGAAVPLISEQFPEAVKAGQVDRSALKALIAKESAALAGLEAIVHPLVQEDRAHFMKEAKQDIGVFDIPLLFETGGDAEMDGTACVSVSRETQRARVLARGTMTVADLERILARQIPNEDKCTRADWVIETDTMEHARAQVQAIVAEIEETLSHA
ncbi:dephospho-CoA kinase [Sagittula marina]|nr:dephospho-CoA kinase [Sagittula marina]